MMRQLGTTYLFCSFLSAETQRIHLQRILGQIVDNKKYRKIREFELRGNV